MDEAGLKPSILKQLYANISQTLRSMEETQRSAAEAAAEAAEAAAAAKARGDKEEVYNDSENAWLYILFVLMFYAFSIVVLMVKYIRREREGTKLEYYYNEFVKRDWYKDKNLYDVGGRRVHYRVDGNTVTKVEVETDIGERRRGDRRRRKSYYEDPDELFGEESDYYYDSEEEEESSNGTSSERSPTKRRWLGDNGSNGNSVNGNGGNGGNGRSVMLCVGAASILSESAMMGMAPLATNDSKAKSGTQEEEEEEEKRSSTKSAATTATTKTTNLRVELGARPKRSSLKNWPLNTPLSLPPVRRRSSSESPDLGNRRRRRKRPRIVLDGGRDEPRPTVELDDYDDQDEDEDDYDATPLAFLRPRVDLADPEVGTRLSLARVDELATVRRVRSLPPPPPPQTATMGAHSSDSVFRIDRHAQRHQRRRNNRKSVRLSSSVRVMPSYYNYHQRQKWSQETSPPPALTSSAAEAEQEKIPKRSSMPRS